MKLLVVAMCGDDDAEGDSTANARLIVSAVNSLPQIKALLDLLEKRPTLVIKGADCEGYSVCDSNSDVADLVGDLREALGL
jgi:hypothetical protein